MRREFAIWHKILELGCHKEQPTSERRRIHLCNQLAIVGVCVSSIYALLFAAYGWKELSWPVLIFVFAYAGFPLMNRGFRGHPGVRHLFIWTIIIEIVLFAGLLGRSAGIHLLLISAVATPLAILDFGRKRPPLIFVVLPLLAYLLLEFTIFDHMIPLPLTSLERRILSAGSIVVAILTNFIILAFFQHSNAVSEASLGETIEHLHNSKQQIEEQQIQLANASRFAAIGELSGGVAHEINNPLAIIMGYTEQNIRLLQTPEPFHERLLQNCEKILRTVNRITKIVLGMQKLSRDGENDNFETYDFREVIRDATSICFESLSHAGIELRVRTPLESCLIHCRPVQLSQVILNLVLNARDAIEKLDEKWIELRLSRVEDKYRLVVQDSGVIKDPYVLQKIGQPFFTTKPPGRGTGLGLSISKRIVTAHQGTLELDRQANTTSFHVTLLPAES